MGRVGAVIHYNLREIVKDRFFYGLLIFALLLLGFGIALGTATFGAEAKIVKDAGLAGAEILGVMLGAVLIIGGVSREIDRRTVYVALTKPMPRWAFILGKYLAAMLAAGGLSAVTVAITIMINGMVENRWAWELGWSVAFMWMQIVLVGSAALFFITVSTPILSGLLTVFLYVIGHTIYEVKRIAETLGGRDRWMRDVVDAAYLVLPDLEKLSVRSDVVVSHMALGPREIVFAFVYTAAFATFFLWVSMLIFSRRDVK